MSNTETIGFTPQLCTVLHEHIRLLGSELRNRYGLSYSQYILLLILFEANQSLSADVFANYTMYKQGTLWHLFLSLEDKELIYKTNKTEDARYMQIQLTQKGYDRVVDISSAMTAFFQELFWSSLPIKDFQQFMRNSMVQSLEDLRQYLKALQGICPNNNGHTYDIEQIGIARTNSDSVLIPSSFYLYWDMLIRTWEAAIYSFDSLSLSQYRILRLVCDNDSVTPRSIAQSLVVPLSQVSRDKKTLVKQGFITQAKSPFDKRSILLKASRCGRKLCDKATVSLDTITRIAHGSLDDDQAIVINAWYMRMYSNIRLNRNKHV